MSSVKIKIHNLEAPKPPGFREQGTSAFRNARDRAKITRDELIAFANTRVTGMLREAFIQEPSSQSISQSIIEPDTLESETSADTLSQNVGRGFSRSKKLV